MERTKFSYWVEKSWQNLYCLWAAGARNPTLAIRGSLVLYENGSTAKHGCGVGGKLSNSDSGLPKFPTP